MFLVRHVSEMFSGLFSHFLGNNLFQKRQFDEALSMFNLSIMFAPFPEVTNGKSEKSQQSSSDSTRANSEDTETSTEKLEEIVNNVTGSNESPAINQSSITGSVESGDVNEQASEAGKENQTTKSEQEGKPARSRRNSGQPTVNGHVEDGKESKRENELRRLQQQRQIESKKKGNQNQKRAKKRKSRGGKSKDENQMSESIVEISKEAKDNATTEIDCQSGGKDNKGNKQPASETQAENTVSEVSGKNTVSGPKRADNAFAMSYVVGNRSASLFFLQLFKECVADVNLAFQLGYPPELAYKLHERKGKCFVHLDQKEEALESFKKAIMCVAAAKLDEKGKQNVFLSLNKQIQQVCEGKERPKAPKADMRCAKVAVPEFLEKRSSKFGCTSAAFKMAVNESRGRHVVAADDVAIAEMVTCEEPYSSILYPEYYTTHCNRYDSKRIHCLDPCWHCVGINLGSFHLGWQKQS